MTDHAIKKLSELGSANLPNCAIHGIAVDSREVREGYLFAALPGSRVHGGEFIQYALRQGAVAILTDAAGAAMAQAEIEKFKPTLWIAADPRQALAHAASLFFGAHPAVAAAVTGTNGKTSVSTFLRQIWLEMDLAAINLGTTGIEGAWAAPLNHTTPEPITLHRNLAEAAAAGITHVAMEASSHGLDQRRLDGVTLRVAGFTNFSQDHLDYHESFDAYFAAKAALFRRLLPADGWAVINCDGSKAAELADECAASGQNLLRVGRAEGSDIHIQGQRFSATGQELALAIRGKSYRIDLPLVGGFQGENLALAIGMAVAVGAEPGYVIDACRAIRPVRGRMELAGTRASGAAVYVDYAHTPDAVETALRALRPHVLGRLIVVLGAGGDRDPGKRVLMGRAAATYADVVFVTDDNPRTEDPAQIRTMVMKGAPEGTEVADRAEAILRAVDALNPADVLLIAGKGHETGQQIGGDVFPFDDVEQASIAIAALDGGM